MFQRRGGKASIKTGAGNRRRAFQIQLLLSRRQGRLGGLTSCVKFSFPHTSEAGCQDRIWVSFRKEGGRFLLLPGLSA